MTNLAVPGLGAFADVGAYMRGVGAAARVAAREIARADTRAKNAALTAIAANAKTALEAQSGVNLDEEAANLVRFQQAFQASGKVMQVASTLLDTLLALK